MRGMRALILGALFVATIGAGGAIVLLRGGGGDESTLRPLRARASLSDRIVVFGDTIEARVDVAPDRRHIDPSKVEVRAAFDPGRRAGPVRVTRRQAGSSAHVEVTYTLRCLKQACVPERDSLAFVLGPARVEFVDRSGRRRSLSAPFPRLIVNTRIAPGDLAPAAPWRVDEANVPVPSYRTSPGLLLVLLIAASLALLSGGGVLAHAGWPRRPVELAAEPDPEPELLPTPLEQALELLENAARGNGAADQRRSLELVAEVLDERGEGDDLARAARALAWSPTAPRIDDTKQLAVRVRATLEEELRHLEEERLREEAERRRRAEEAHARAD